MTEEFKGRRHVAPFLQMPVHVLKRIRVAAVTLLLCLSSAAAALDIPPPPAQWVTDRAGVLSAAEVDQLNAKLRAFEQRSGAQFIFYILPSLEGEALEDFTVRTAQKWGVGQKKYDNGLIVFVFTQDRKVRVEVGYGLEGTITDAISSRVIRQAIVPAFQRGRYAEGLNAAADFLIARIEKNEAPVPVSGGSQQRPAAQPGVLDLLFFLFIAGFFLFFVFPLLRRGGCGGCGCLPFFPMPGGVTFGGGRWGGGGFSGGGFGGFSGGGGSFGGGGASGSW